MLVLRNKVVVTFKLTLRSEQYTALKEMMMECVSREIMAVLESTTIKKENVQFENKRKIFFCTCVND